MLTNNKIEPQKLITITESNPNSKRKIDKGEIQNFEISFILDFDSQ